jgi:hypothetical protein
VSKKGVPLTTVLYLPPGIIRGQASLAALRTAWGLPSFVPNWNGLTSLRSGTIAVTRRPPPYDQHVAVVTAE